MRRPAAAIIDDAKITSYLLSPTHPLGAAKAATFRRYGFRLDAWEELRLALLQHARDNEVARRVATQFGTKYVVDGPLAAPDGSAPPFRTIWFVENGEDPHGS